MTNSTGQACAGAKARTERVPASAARAARFAPADRATQVANRSSVTRRRPAGAASVSLAGLARVDAEFLDASPVGLEDLESDAARVAHELSSHRNAARKREHETAERVDIFFLLGRDQALAEIGLQLLDRRQRIGDEPLARVLPDPGLRHVVLVLDLAHHLLHQVLDGDETVGAAIFVDYQGKVDARRLHLEQQIDQRHRGGHVENIARDVDVGDAAAEIDGAEIELRCPDRPQLQT